MEKENDFERNGKAHVFNKPAVKICTYASLFQGGKKAMTEGIMKYFSDQVGMKPDEFKESSFYLEADHICSGVVKLMIEHPFITSFQGISKLILRDYHGKYLKGPTGHRYFVSPEYFKHIFPCFLQSYEIALIAESTNRVIKTFPKVHAVGHFHDGNVLMVPAEQQQQVITYYKESVRNLGQELRLNFPQELEVQETFKPLEVKLEELEVVSQFD